MSSSNEVKSHEKIGEIMEAVKNWGRVIKVAVVGIGILASSYLVPKWTMDHQHEAKADEQHQSFAALPVAVPVVQQNSQSIAATPAVALPSSGVSFVVQSVGQSKSGKKFLNSLADYRAAGNQTIVLEGAAASLDANSMKGRSITAYGRQATYKGRPETVVSNPANLQIR